MDTDGGFEVVDTVLLGELDGIETVDSVQGVVDVLEEEDALEVDETVEVVQGAVEDKVGVDNGSE